jgi:hypothetical protein
VKRPSPSEWRIIRRVIEPLTGARRQEMIIDLLCSLRAVDVTEEARDWEPTRQELAALLPVVDLTAEIEEVRDGLLQLRRPRAPGYRAPSRRRPVAVRPVRAPVLGVGHQPHAQQGAARTGTGGGRVLRGGGDEHQGHVTAPHLSRAGPCSRRRA